MADRTMLQQVVLDEIAGKIKAIHAYDQTLWVIRSGFLTIFFAAWGLLLTTKFEPGVVLASASQVITTMFWVSVGLAVGGLLLDALHVCRKYRVIGGLNKLFSTILDYPELNKYSSIATDLKTSLKDVIIISGARGGKHCLELRFVGALIPTLLIYCVPLVSLRIGLSLSGLWG